jgi:16S rRNA (cytosine1402-N4)-methyltransferase
MLEQVMDLLQPKSGGVYVDLTLGAGGHARAILEQSAPDGRLIVFDRDPAAIAYARSRLGDFSKRLLFCHNPFSELPEVLEQEAIDKVDGILADLGVCSVQLDNAERGFSFQRAGPLDMRMDPTRDVPLAKMLRHMDEQALAIQLRSLGDVSSARKIARKILRAVLEDGAQSTVELAKAIGRSDQRGRTHPATRVFMACRMLVNDELGQLDSILKNLPDPLSKGGRIVFIAFHSLEDRAIKKRFQRLEGRCTCPHGLPVCACGRKPEMKMLVSKALKADEDEVARNPRSRSARLRGALRL